VTEIQAYARRIGLERIC